MSVVALPWLLAAVNVGLFGAMRAGAMRAGPMRQIGKTGRAFDARLGGCTLEDTRKFPIRLPDRARDRYLGRQSVLDSLLHLLWSAPFGLLLSILPAATGFADATENARVARMVRAGADGVTDSRGHAASRATRAKFALFGLSATAILIGWAL